MVLLPSTVIGIQCTKEKMNMGDENNDVLRRKQLQEVVRARIEQLCKEEGISYYGLSYKSTLPMTTLSHVMDGTTQNTGVYTIMKVCDGLGISLKEFFDTKEFEKVMSECD